ncbi:MAG: hypothetical protein EOP75_00020 [Variovorax sp.]|nr:MAG: hypothetical protein EOP75_00020 [Variovorax sp.]
MISPIAYGETAFQPNGATRDWRHSCTASYDLLFGLTMKIILWIVFIIFLIGLAVVLGLGKLIF